jgi:hypothetical protein
MPPVAVYRFEIWDHEVGDNATAPPFATLAAIGRVHGNPIFESMRAVDSGDLDGNGFFPKPGVWLVKIFDLVSRQDGTARRSVPLGEYTMREVSTEL